MTTGVRSWSSAFSEAFGPRTTPSTQTGDPWLDDTVKPLDPNEPFEDQRRLWPIRPKPASAVFRIESPTIRTSSLSGASFTQSLGYEKYSLSLTYTNISTQAVHYLMGIISAAQGGSKSFYIDMNLSGIQGGDGTLLLGYYGDSNVDNIVFKRYPTGKTREDRQFILGGFEANKLNAMPLGTFMSGFTGFFGGICQNIIERGSDENGEVLVATSYPPTADPMPNDPITIPPRYLAVTLGSDLHEFSHSLQRVNSGTVNFICDMYNRRF